MQRIKLSNGLEFDFLCGITPKSYSAKVIDGIVHVSWTFDFGGSITYYIDYAERAIVDGQWKIVGEIRNAETKDSRIFQIGLDDGTWRDVSEQTYEEVKTWPTVKHFRIVEVI